MLSRLKRDLTMAEAARTPGGARVDLLAVADMVDARRQGARRRLRRRRAAAASGRDARRRRPRHRAFARGRERMRRQGPGGDPGRRRHRPLGLSRRRLRLRHPVADAAGDAPAARGARAHAAHRPPRHRVVPEFRPLAHPPADHVRRPHAAHRQSALCLVGIAQHPFLHASRISASSAKSTGAKMEKAVALNAWGRALRFNAPWWFWNLLGEQAVFLLSRRS